MQKVNVNKEDLLSALQSNGSKHVQEYLTAIQGWRDKAVEQLKEKITELESMDLSDPPDDTKFPSLWIDANTDRPTCHDKDYDRAIGMLEWSTDDTVSVTAEEFDQFVNDDWEWKQQFATSNAKYGR